MLKEVVTTISPDDLMYVEHEHYMATGREAVELIGRYAKPERMLDFGCGHGRVLRFLRAEYPEAEIWACDVDPGAVGFCAETFGVHGIVSSTNPAEVELPTVDLIWAGSVFTHLPEPRWRAFLHKFAGALSPGGVLIFTTGGQWATDELRAGEPWGLPREVVARVVQDFDAHGFGYADYSATSGYGLTRVSRPWVEARLRDAGLSLLSYDERGWSGRQDVVTASA